MSGIKAPIQDVLNLIKGITQFQTIRVWNNQIAHEREGNYPSYAKPACFVEVLNDVTWGQLAQGDSSADLMFRFHIAHEFYDAQDGSFEQDLAVIDLRDAVIAAVMLTWPTGCGPMTKINEGFDYDHDNIYEYLVDFVTHFIDDTGAVKTITKQPPTDIEIDASFSAPKNYVIPQP